MTRATDLGNLGRGLPLLALASLVLLISGCGDDDDSTTGGSQGGGSQGAVEDTSVASPITFNGQPVEITLPEANRTCQQLHAFSQNGLDIAAKLAGIVSLGRLDEEAIGIGTIAVKIADAYCPEYQLTQPQIAELND
jgi:hypothetical protein